MVIDSRAAARSQRAEGQEGSPKLAVSRHRNCKMLVDGRRSYICGRIFLSVLPWNRPVCLPRSVGRRFRVTKWTRHFSKDFDCVSKDGQFNTSIIVAIRVADLGIKPLVLQPWAEFVCSKSETLRARSRRAPASNAKIFDCRVSCVTPITQAGWSVHPSDTKMIQEKFCTTNKDKNAIITCTKSNKNVANERTKRKAGKHAILYPNCTKTCNISENGRTIEREFNNTCCGLCRTIGFNEHSSYFEEPSLFVKCRSWASPSEKPKSCTIVRVRRVSCLWTRERVLLYCMFSEVNGFKTGLFTIRISHRAI